MMRARRQPDEMVDVAARLGAVMHAPAVPAPVEVASSAVAVVATSGGGAHLRKGRPARRRRR